MNSPTAAAQTVSRTASWQTAEENAREEAFVAERQREANDRSNATDVGNGVWSEESWTVSWRVPGRTFAWGGVA